jgi:hypothetical protein
MSEATMVHVFGAEDLLEIERIVVDEDRDAALTFLRAVRAAIQQRQAHHCRPVFEWSNRKPGQWAELQAGGNQP